MSERMKLYVSRSEGGVSDIRNEATHELVARVYTTFDVVDARYIVAAVNDYDPGAVPALTSESQWIPQTYGGINAGVGNVTWWSAEKWAQGGVPAVSYTLAGSSGDYGTSGLADTMLFLRHMARVMGAAFPEAIKELLV